MKLSLKIAALIGLGATVLVFVVSLLSLRRDLGLVEQDIRRDAELVALSVAVACRGRTPDEVAALLSEVDDATDGLLVRQVPGDGERHIELRVDAMAATIPIPGQSGSIEVVESLAPRDRVLEGSIRSLILTTSFVMLISLVGGLWVGRWLVGRRVDALVEKARRVAQGQFDEPVVVGGSDELSVMAAELNLMAGQLARARARSVADAEARIEAQIQLRHADRLRTVGQLSAGIAHELGSPLNVIAGRASLLLRGLPPHQEEHARTIREQASRITAIVRRLLDYSRRNPPKPEPVDLRRLVEETVALLRPLLVSRTLEVQLDSGDCTVQGDLEQLRQVLTNLVLNASQAVADQGTIRVRLASRADGVALQVEDDGPGVPEELRERVLEPFFTTKEPGEGTGLGLSVVTGIVEDHEGTLTVGASELGGASFLVLLPKENA